MDEVENIDRPPQKRRVTPLPERSGTAADVQTMTVAADETVVSADLPDRASARSVMWLSFPAIIESLLQAVIALTDTWIAGHISTDPKVVSSASAAIGMMTYLQWFSGLMTAALGVGATAIVARAIGAKRPRVANRTAGTCLSAAFIVGLIVAAGLFLFAQQVADFCELHGLASTYAVQYLHIMTITIALGVTSGIGLATLRGAGNTVAPMVVTGLVAVTNLLTASTFTFGLFGMPAWGIRGNAFGTMLAFFVGGVATLSLLLSRRTRLKIELRHFKIVPHVLGRVLKIGLPSWAEGVLLWTGQFLVVKFAMNAHDDQGVILAAHNAVLRVESLAFLPGFGFGIAASSLVGRYLGARRVDEAVRAAHIAKRLAVITMTLAAIPMVFAPRYMLSLLVTAPAVLTVGTIPMLIAGLAQPGFAYAICMSGGLKGAGETVWPMLSTVIGTFLIRIPILFVALEIFKRQGHPEYALIAVWIGIFVDLNFRALVTSIIFHRGKWKKIKV